MASFWLFFYVYVLKTDLRYTWIYIIVKSLIVIIKVYLKHTFSHIFWKCMLSYRCKFELLRWYKYLILLHISSISKNTLEFYLIFGLQKYIWSEAQFHIGGSGFLIFYSIKISYCLPAPFLEILPSFSAFFVVLFLWLNKQSAHI